ncbi:tight adherence protein B [Salinibacillus kushneri]|uniref:Tight adherence protein B n=1 Tax=Salinibacillus kushneri TaxID=237682 RepID=A0A1I0J5S2_9BACI|nr:type II secretion system F family protein [Salinibacillus kushneri]SEU05171.1 tight adherence protein B [Salinibacillus kushneri]
MTVALATTVSVLSFLIGITFYLDYRKGKRDWRKQAEEFYQVEERRKSFIVLWGDRYDQTEAAKPMFNKLRAANIPLTPSEFIGAQIVTFMGLIFVLSNLFHLDFLISFIISILFLEAAKKLIFLLRKNKMKERMAEQLPEICRILANATRSGMTLNQGIQLVAQEINEPAKAEFKQLAHELSLGIEFNSALRSMDSRINNREFKLFVATVLIQKKAGGNLSAILEEMSQTLEDRQILKQEIKTMTAEQRYISYLVPVIPVFLVLMMNNIIDGFLDPLLSGIGIVIALLFIGGTVATFLLVRKVTNIRM